MINSLVNKKKILKNFLDICTLDGWNNKSLGDAVIKSGFKLEDQELIFDNGIHSLIDFFIDQNNEKMRKKAAKIDFTKLRVRDKIKELVKIRLLIEEDNKNALQSLITISKGERIPNLAKNTYKVTDLMWEIIGDKSTDFNFYTKRLILSKVLTRTTLCFINDTSKNHKKSWDLLDDQIEKVMKLGEIKMKMKNYMEKIQSCANKTSNLKSNLKKLPFIRLINPNT